MTPPFFVLEKGPLSHQGAARLTGIQEMTGFPRSAPRVQKQGTG